MNYLPTPIFRLCSFFILGIILESQFNLFTLSSNLLALLVSILCFFVVQRYAQFEKKFYQGIIISFQFLFLGSLLMGTSKKQSDLYLDQANFYEVVLTDPIKETRTGYRLNVTVQASYAINNDWINTDEAAILYVSKCTKIQQLKPRDRLLIQANFNPISQPKNPYAFDYSQYLKHQGIYASAYIDSLSFRILPAKATAFSLTIFFNQVKTYVYQCFANMGLSANELSVVMALTIGDKQYLDPDLKQAYATAGAVHLLAVSGLHVGIIYGIIVFLFSFFPNNFSWRVSKSLMVLIFLWIYAFLVGASPSILRASFMFSLFVFSDLANRSNNSYNTLACSAFVLLLIQPNLLFDLGFQLSYSAVLGILYFYPKWTHWLTSKKLVFRVIGNLFFLSLSAQLATLPFILYYFNQFPTFFLLANLFVVPLCSVVMYLSVLSLVLAPFDFLTVYTGYLLQISTQLMNTIVLFFEQLPGALITGIYLNITQALGLTLVILFFAAYFYQRRLLYILFSLGSLLFVISLSSLRQIEWKNQINMGVYAVKGSFVYFLEHKNGWYVADSVALSQNLNFQINNHLIRYGHHSWKALQAYSVSDLPNSVGGICMFDGKRIAFASQLYLQNKIEAINPLTVDVLIVQQAVGYKASAILSCYVPQLIVLDGSLNRYAVQVWKEQASNRGIELWNVQTDGAWQLISSSN